MDIEQFYSADERRRRSAEVELGTEWHDARGNRYELSWVEDTGELYVMLERVPEADSWTPFGDIEVESVPVDQLLVRVVGHVATRQELERVLEGWQAAMPGPDSVSWVADRLRQHGVAAG
ncbi:MAG: hypothetical protein ACP5P9_08255 [Acidimicrobiales bacterium]